MSIKIITKSGVDRFLRKLGQSTEKQHNKLEKVHSVLLFLTWLKNTNHITQDDFVLYSSPLKRFEQNLATKVKKPAFFGLSTDAPAVKYVGFALGIISLAVLATGLYLRFFVNTKTPFAYSGAPVQAGRTISFQGRLTDTLGNPINAPINMTYNFYTTSTGGSPISGSTRVCTANPDQDGIFSNLIGNDTGPSCNTELPNSIFTENPSIYLGVTVGTEITEMSPRQQIANVGYAINSETLQGMPPGQTASSIPYINKDGNLLIATSNPGIRSTYASSNFTISSAQAVTIQSAGSGDITLSASEGGALRFNTYNGTLLERLTVLNNGNVGISNTNPTQKLDVGGNATVSGDLTAGGQVQVGRFNYVPMAAGAGSIYFNTTDNTPYYFNGSSWTAFSSGGGGGGYWTIGNGALFPVNSTLDALIGGTASTSAKFAFINVGGGTPTASIAGSLANVSTYVTGDGNIGTTNMAALTLGNASTGPIQLSPKGTTGLFVAGNGNVGINTTNPGTNLDVAGNIGLGQDNFIGYPAALAQSYKPYDASFNSFLNTTKDFYLNLDSDNNDSDTTTFVIGKNRTGNAGGSELFRVNENGNVGIGTVNPSEKLDVTGNATVSGNISLGGQLQLGRFAYSPTALGGGSIYFNTADNTPYYFNGSSWTQITSSTQYWQRTLGSLAPLNITDDLNIGSTATGSALVHLPGTNDQNAWFNLGTGNVGIGTTDPTTKLNVAGTASVSGHMAIGGTGSIDGGFQDWSSTFSNGLTIAETSEMSSAYTTGIATDIKLSPPNGNGNWAYGNLTRIYSDNLNPGSWSGGEAMAGYFDHQGSGTVGSAYGGDFEVYSTGDGIIDNAVGLYGYANGRGTNNTGGQFEAIKNDLTGGSTYGTRSSAQNSALTSSGTDNTYGNYVTVNRSSATGGTINTYGQYINLSLDNAGAGTHTAYGLYLDNVTGADENFSLYSNGGKSYFAGNIGIGDTTPDHTLDVVGNIGMNANGYLNWGDTDGSTGYGIRDNSGIIEFKNNAGIWAALGGSSSNYWNIANGTIYPVNSTLDALIGGTASSSAKFAFLNVNSGTPVASIASTLANVNTYLTGSGTLGTTNRQSLILGNSATYNTTGDIYLNPNGTGNVGVGITTINPSYKMHVGGDILANALYDTTSPGSYYVNPAGVSNFGTGLIVEGYIGVNTAGPDRKLEVLDTANPQLRLTYADNVTYADFQMTSSGDLITNVDGTTNQLVLDNGGTVGVGTATPRNNLEVGNTTSNQSVRIGGVYRGPGSGYTGLDQETTRHQLVFSSWRDIQTDTVGAKIAAINKTAGTGPSWDLTQYTDLAFYTLGSTPTSTDDTAERMRITAGGNVGIGVTAPSAFLDLAASTTSKASLNLSSSAGTNPSAPTSGDFWWNGTNLNFYNGSSTIDILAGAGIWTDGGTFIYPTAGETLGNSLSGGANKVAGLYLATSAPLTFGNTNDISFSFASSTLTTTLGSNAWNVGSNLWYLNGSTNQVGIGTNSPLATLDVRALSGTTPVASFSGSTSYATMIVDQSGVGDIFTASRSGQTQFVITKDGYVGIGVANPTSRLSVAGSTSTLSNSSGDIIIDSASNFINFSGDALTNVGNIASIGQIQVGGFGSPPSALGNGAMYYDTASNKIFYWDGSVWSEMGSKYWQRNLGSLAPQYITDDINVGAIATGSAIVHLPGLTNQNAFFNLGSGSFGINTTSPNSSYKLHVNGDILANALYDTTSPGSWFINPAGGTSIQIAGDIKMDGKINLTGASVAPMIDSDDGTSTWSTITIKGSNDTTSASLCIEGTGTGANCDGKLNVGTVDPPYTINGKKYATYFASMTGVKEETTGKITLTQKNPHVNAYSSTIYFDSEADGSDLWLFNKTTSLKKQYADLTVLMTANSNARTWYSYDPQDNSLTFFSTSPTQLSYRLSAPRFDSAKWANKRSDSDRVIGFVVNDQGVLTPTDKSLAQNTIQNSADTEYRGDLVDFKQKNSLFTLTGDFVDQFMSVSQGVFAQIQAGFIQTQNMIVQSTLVATKVFTDSLNANTANVNKIQSPVAELDTISTRSIEPKTDKIAIKLNNQPGSLAKLVIEGLNNKEVAVFDNQGNATLSGTLIADTVETNSTKTESLEASNATISGTLVADTIKSTTIDTLQTNVASLGSTLATNGQKLTSDINDIQQQLALLANSQQQLPSSQYYQNLDASYANLTVTGTSNLYKAHIADSLLTGSILIQTNSVLALSNDLFISSLGTIRLFDDAVIIAKNGTMAVKGDISAHALAIKNDVGEIVASIDSSGSARFNEVIAKKLSIDNIATQAALIGDSGQVDAYNNPIPGIVTNAEAAGNAVILRDTQELIIYNDSVTPQSLIYLTPTSETATSPLTVSQKHSCDLQIPSCKPYFSVKTDQLLHPDWSFNWLIIN
jgi:hypothetical protein